MPNDPCEKCIAKDTCAATDYSVERVISMIMDILNVSHTPVDIAILAINVLQERMLAKGFTEVPHVDA